MIFLLIYFDLIFGCVSLFIINCRLFTLILLLLVLELFCDLLLNLQLENLILLILIEHYQLKHNTYS